VLRLTSVVTCYGGITALRGVSIHVAEGEIVALIGANGAGKTTLLDTISGVITPRSGSISFMGQNVQGMATERLVRMGMSHVPQGRLLFPDMSVYDNLILGAYRQPSRGKKVQMSSDLEYVYSIFPVMAERSLQLAGTLSGG
jgi:branched-chain amino acid transport system ATP-binding protein